jgi:16S rRNA processing protein RimM
MNSSQDIQDYSVVGVILKSFGVRGEAKIQPQSSDLNRHRSLKRVCFFSPKNEFLFERKIESSRESQGYWYFKFEGIPSPEAVTEYRGFALAVPLSERPQLPEGEFYHSDLIGLEVIDLDGNSIGQVLDIQEYPSCQTFILKIKNQEVLAPWVEGCIGDISLEKKTLSVNIEFLRDTYPKI